MVCFVKASDLLWSGSPEFTVKPVFPLKQKASCPEEFPTCLSLLGLLVLPLSLSCQKLKLLIENKALMFYTKPTFSSLSTSFENYFWAAKRKLCVSICKVDSHLLQSRDKVVFLILSCEIIKGKISPKPCKAKPRFRKAPSLFLHTQK